MPDSLTPSERSMRARLAVHTSWASTTNRTARTAPGRQAFLSRFEEEARRRHPNASDEEVARAADHLKQAHFLRLSLKAAKARREKAQGAAS